MKSENALYVSVIIKEYDIIAANSFDYEEAKNDMIQMLNLGFDFQNDDGMIFKLEKKGPATIVFNYRAYINQEPDNYKPSPKANENIKIFFDCPKCHNHKFKIVPDEDGDFFANCSNPECNHYELIRN